MHPPGEIGTVIPPLTIATRLNQEDSTLEDGLIKITEFKIPGEENDIALIKARTNTPIQRYKGDGLVTEIFYNSIQVGTDIYDEKGEYINAVPRKIGVILMSPEGEISTFVYDPTIHGGSLRGYQITNGWRMQTIVPDGVEFTFLDDWTPKGFNSLTEDGEYYGEKVLVTEEDENIITKFKSAKEELMQSLI